jgi:prevent-host-death family protein
MERMDEKPFDDAEGHNLTPSEALYGKHPGIRVDPDDDLFSAWDPGPAERRDVEGDVRTIGATEFKQRCLQILDELGPDGIIVTKRGKPVARVLPPERGNGDLIGSLKGLMIVDPKDDLFSTGAWVSDEWGDLNNG